MSASLAFEWDSRDLDVWLGGKVTLAVNRAVRLAGNQGLRVMQDESADYITSRKMLRVEEVKKGLALHKPRASAELAELIWVLVASGAPVPLAKFPHIDTRRSLTGRGRGVGVQVNVGKGSTMIPHAFTATMRSGHEGIFERRGDERLPIDELFSTRLSDPLRDAGVAVGIESHGYRKLAEAFKKSLNRQIKNLKRKGYA